MADTNEAAQRIKAHADSLASVPHNAQFRADLYELCEQATPPADAALAEYCERAARNWTKGCDMHIGLMCAAAALRARPQAVAEVYCVGRANYPQRGGNVGLQWHVVGVADVPYRTCVPKNGELLFVLAASQSADVKAGGGGVRCITATYATRQRRKRASASNAPRSGSSCYDGDISDHEAMRSGDYF